MVKEQFQKELKDKVKPGVKPSDLRKLKRSKSAGDIPSAPTSPTTKLKDLESQISTLELKLEVKNRELIALEVENKQLKNNPPTQLLTDQLKEKQTHIETLRERLETTNTELNKLKETNSAVLDENLVIKHQSLKDWWQQYEKNKDLERELVENIDYASDELTNQDQTISQLRTENSRLQQTNQSLQKDLNLATKLAELRKYPLPDNSPNLDYLKYAFYGLITVVFISLLNTSWKLNRNYE